MTTGHEPFDQQIHDAFDQIELSDEAQDRMLARLMAAQASKAEERADEEEAHEAEVIAVPPRRIPWGRWASLAAVVIAALVVVRITTLAPNGSFQAVSISSQDMAEKSEAVESTDAAAAPEAAAADQEAKENAPTLEYDVPLSDEFVSDEAVEQPEELTAPLVSIELDNGMWFTTAGIDPLTGEVDLERIGELVGAGTAYAVDVAEDEPGVVCEVFSLLDEEDAFAVRLEGEQVYWRCVPA